MQQYFWVGLVVYCIREFMTCHQLYRVLNRRRCDSAPKWLTDIALETITWSLNQTLRELKKFGLPEFQVDAYLRQFFQQRKFLA